MSTPIPGLVVFMDTETTGLSAGDHIWEFAAVRREPGGHERAYHVFVRHDLDKAARLPESFRVDHDTRYRADMALAPFAFACLLGEVFAGRPLVVGDVPNFDTTRFSRLLRHYNLPDAPWYYHLRDVENVAYGWLIARAGLGDPTAREALADPLNTDALSLACGVVPAGPGMRHTAMGDVRWIMKWWDAITALPPAAGRV